MILSLFFLLISASLSESLNCSTLYDCPKTYFSPGYCDNKGVCTCHTTIENITPVPSGFGCALGINTPYVRLSDKLQEHNFDIIQGSKVSFVCDTEQLQPFVTKWFRNGIEIKDCSVYAYTITAKTPKDVANISCLVQKNGIVSAESDSISLRIIELDTDYKVRPVAVQKYYSAMDGSEIDMACGNIPIGSKFSWIDGLNKTVEMPIKLTKVSFFTPYVCQVKHSRINFINPKSKPELILDTYFKDGLIPDRLKNYNTILESIKSPKEKDSGLLDFIDSYYKNYTFHPYCGTGVYSNGMQLTSYFQFKVNMTLRLTCGCTFSSTSIRKYPKYSNRRQFKHKTKAKTSCELLSSNGLWKKSIDYNITKDSKDRVIKYKLIWQDSKDASEFEFILDEWNKTAFKIWTENKIPLYKSDYSLSVSEISGSNLLANTQAVYVWRKNGVLLTTDYGPKIYMNNLTDNDLGNYTATVTPCMIIRSEGFNTPVIQKCLKWASLFPELKGTFSYSLNALHTTPATPEVVKQEMPVINFDEGTSTELETESETEESTLKEGDYITLACVTDSVTIGMRYKWLKDGNPIQYESQNELKIHPLSKKDRGDYTCIAMFNGHRSLTSKPYVLSFNKTMQLLPTSITILFLLLAAYIFGKH